MELSATLYLGLLGAVSCGRIAELAVSRRNGQRLFERGARTSEDPVYPLMVVFHTGMLAATALEVVLLRRPLIPWLAGITAFLFLLANALRLWVIRTLADLWYVRVMDSTALGVVTSGPYRMVRHPNYTGVFIEMTALPLIHTAWLTAAVGTLVHLPILWMRVKAEECALMRSPEYVAAFSAKPRFLPRLRAPERAS